VADEQGYAVMGGSAEVVSGYLKERYQPLMPLDDALRLAVDALGHDAAQVRRLTADRLEVAVLDRTRSQPRKFRRIRGARLTALFGRSTDEPPTPGATAEETDEREPGTSTQGGAVATDENAPEAGRDETAGGAGPGDAGVTGSESPSESGEAPEDPSDVLGDLPDDREQS
jgi:proteasome alpha subunit